jgi:hypothetical protein
MNRSARRRAAYLMRISAPPLPSLERITNLLRRLRRRRINQNCPGVTLVDIAVTDAIRACRTGVCSHIPYGVPRRNPNRHLSNYQIRRMTPNPKHQKWDRATRQVGKGRNCLANIT